MDDKELREKTVHILRKHTDNFELILPDKLMALFRKDREAAYPWKRITRHMTCEIPYIDLDKDPTGATIELQECYMLPKKWVDEQLTQTQERKT